jgi:hypothetical protein
MTTRWAQMSVRFDSDSQLAIKPDKILQLAINNYLIILLLTVF